MTMLRIGIILGSTRPGRIGEGVAKWVYSEARKRPDAEFELVDVKDYDLPLLDEPVPAGMSSNYTKPHTKKWSSKISSFDAFLFVTPEYNHGPSGALKNAIDFLYAEWNNKVAGFVGYGSVGGTRVVETLRLIMAELQVATVRTQLALSLRSDFENFKNLKPAPYHVKTLNKTIDEVISWGTAMRGVRLEEEESNSEGLAGKFNEDQRPSVH
jgi:NAD(P)H-dependent FMN reductase